MTMAEFRQRQENLRQRVRRLPARSRARLRLEGELQGLVRQELLHEVAGPDLVPVPEYPDDDDEGQPLKYFQK